MNTLTWIANAMVTEPSSALAALLMLFALAYAFALWAMSRGKGAATRA